MLSWRLAQYADVRSPPASGISPIASRPICKAASPRVPVMHGFVYHGIPQLAALFAANGFQSSELAPASLWGAFSNCFSKKIIIASITAKSATRIGVIKSAGIHLVVNGTHTMREI